MARERKRIVIFCGAGFSAPAGIPVMAGFTDCLRDSGYLNAEEQRDFDNIQRHCDSLGASIGVSSRNLEQLASFLAILDMNTPRLKVRDCRIFTTPKDALLLVKRCIQHLVRPNIDSDSLRYTDPIFSSVVKSGYHVDFVTTNYDLVIELAITRSGTSCRVKPTETILEAARTAGTLGTTSLYGESAETFGLFKLHGSVNWSANVSRFTCHHHLVDHGLRLEDLPKDFESLIVPPTIIKPQIDEILREQWMGAAKALGIADMIWFIGYSFPESDSFMRYFLAAALTDNMKIRRLLVVNGDHLACQRASSIFRTARLQEALRLLERRMTGVAGEGEGDPWF